MIKGFLRPVRSTIGQQEWTMLLGALGGHTDELNKDPDDYDLPSTRDTVDHERSVTTETEVLVNGGSEVVATMSASYPMATVRQ
jgi:hypothetical protein